LVFHRSYTAINHVMLQSVLKCVHRSGGEVKKGGEMGREAGGERRRAEAAQRKGRLAQHAVA